MTWRTGDRVRQDGDAYLWFESRTDDVIVSAGYRIGPFEVESARSPTPRWLRRPRWPLPTRSAARWSARRSCSGRGREGSEALTRELQDHVKETSAPYKYPRVVDFTEALPKTPSGKIKRGELRGG